MERVSHLVGMDSDMLVRETLGAVDQGDENPLFLSLKMSTVPWRRILTEGKVGDQDLLKRQRTAMSGCGIG